MAVRYHVMLEPKNGGMSVTRKFDSTIETSSIPGNEIAEIQRMCSHFNWSQSGVSQRIGETLYTIVNGENKLLESAIVKADAHGEPLQLFIEGPAPDLPFELLYKSQFLVPFKIHVIHRVSDYGCEKEVNSENHPLKVLFMACSPQDAEPVLDYEKEEDTILDVTKKFPVDIDVEDTGSLQGLKDRLSHYYDVVYISGHADIDEGTPIFLMEDETGYRVPVTPEDLWDALKLNPPRLLFLSGCRTGQAPEHEAAVSFAHQLVLKHSSTVLGWGLPVSDPGAMKAAENLFFELSRGKSILDAVFSARQELYDNEWPDWSLLRLFSDGTPLDVPLVEEGQKLDIKARDIQYAYLQNSQVKVLKKGFVGRRRQIQRGIKSLKDDEAKSGLLLHGTGGLGKSCLAGKFCDRFKDHALIIVHGKLTAAKFLEAVKGAFIRTGDDDGLEIVQQRLEIPDKVRVLCSVSFQKEKYLIVLDDFEKNLKGLKQGTPVLSDEVLPILYTLLQYLPLAVKKTQLIITSRYTFPLTVNGRDLVEERLESIGLTSFRGADERKKVAELQYIDQYDDPDIRRKLIDAGRGNPRLMEALNSLIMAEKVVDKALLKKVKGKQEEFVQELILREILESQPQNFQKVMQHASVYELPVSKKGLEKVCGKIKNWKSFIDSGVQLSLIEKGRDRMVYYWVTPLLRGGIFKDLSEDEQELCHEGAVKYYQEVVAADGYEPMYAFELIEHALLCGMDEAAVKEGGRLLSYLHDVLLYKEALSEGGHILSSISGMKENEESALFLNGLGMIFYDVGDFRKAIPCFEKALKIDRKIYGEEHPSVATRLNNLGGAWDSLGDYKKAVQYFEKALEIDKKIYGEEHPDVAATLNNLGGAWYSLGDYTKAVQYYEKALEINKEVYGENYSYAATTFNNLGLAWKSLGNPKKAIEYYEKALEIDRKVYGEEHPDVATMLNNLGAAWRSLGDYKKAVQYYEKALEIDRKVYGEEHPSVATDLNNLGGAWGSLGDYKKAVQYYEKALEIDRKVYGEEHPDVATMLNNLGMAWRSLGDYKKAVEYYEKALKIDKKVYGEEHPSVATDLNNLGGAWDSLGDHKKAVQYYEKALSIIIKMYGEKHPYAAKTLGNLGIAWLSLKSLKKAIEYIQKAYTIFQEVLGENHPDTRATKEMLDILKRSLNE